MFWRRFTHRYWGIAILAGLTVLFAREAFALQISGTTGNTTDPTTGSPPYVFNGGTFEQAFPWDNVGRVNGGSAIFLGNVNNDGRFWVITAYHVAPGLPTSAVFDSGTYGTVSGSWVQLTNSDSSLADIVIFQLAVSSNPGDLVTLPLISTTPPNSTGIYDTAWGNGSDNTGPQRWGYNTVTGTGYGNDSFANVAYYYVTYDSSAPNSSQGILGDSGGGGFVYDPTSQSWELAGMLYGVNGNTTASADMSQYRSQIIITPVPAQPGAIALLVCGAACLFFANRSLCKKSGDGFRG